MIDISAAATRLKQAVPGVTIQKQVEYNGKFVFLVQPPDSDEPPVLFSVDKSSEEVMDLVPWQVEDPLKLQDLLLKAG